MDRKTGEICHVGNLLVIGPSGASALKGMDGQTDIAGCRVAQHATNNYQ